MLRKFFQDMTRQLETPEQPEDAETALRLATAALLVEMARADFAPDSDELSLVRQLLVRRFKLADAEVAALLEQADQRVEDAVSLHEFTQWLNRQFSAADKLQMIEMLWRVAFADNRLHANEEYLVRKIADLLHVPHPDFIQARHRVEAGG